MVSTLFALICLEGNDPTSYVVEDINVTKTLAFLKELNESQSEVKVTMTHVAGHSIAWGLYKMRRDVGRITFGYFSHSKRIGTTVLVDVEGGQDLVPITLWNAHELSLIEFAKACNERVQIAKAKKDEGHNKSTAGANFIPSFLLQPMVWTASYINVNLGVAIP